MNDHDVGQQGRLTTGGLLENFELIKGACQDKSVGEKTYDLRWRRRARADARWRADRFLEQRQGDGAMFSGRAQDAASAASRVTTIGGDWYRPDGVKLLDTASDLNTSSRMAPT